MHTHAHMHTYTHRYTKTQTYTDAYTHTQTQGHTRTRTRTVLPSLPNTVYLNELNVVLISASGGRTIVSTGRKLVMGVFNNEWVVEVSQHGQQEASVPVVCHSSSVVTLPSQVRDRFKRDCVIFVYKQLKQRQM